MAIKKSLQKLPENERKLIEDESRRNVLERVQKHRLNKILNASKESHKSAPVNFENSFKTKNTLGKAIAKVKRAMPQSPTRKKAVLSRLLDAYDLTDQNEIILNSSLGKNKQNLGRPCPNLETVHSVEKFFLRDDVSRVSPNSKDVKFYINRVTGKKESHSTRYLLMTMKEVLAKYKEENGISLDSGRYLIIRVILLLFLFILFKTMGNRI